MANIGSFEKSGSEFQGEIVTLSVPCGRPLGFKGESENSEQTSTSTAGTLNGFSGSSVRPSALTACCSIGPLRGPIVISFSSFIPAPTHVRRVHQPRPGSLTRVIVTQAVWAILCSITAEAPWRFDRLEFGEIELDNRAQRVGERTVLLVVRQRVQPAGILGLQLRGSGDGVVPPPDPGAPIGGTACANGSVSYRAIEWI
jgi:hypothetical protein